MIWVFLVQRERKFAPAGMPRRSKFRLLIAATAIWFTTAFGMAEIVLLSFGPPDGNFNSIDFFYTILAFVATATVVWWLAMRRKAG